LLFPDLIKILIIKDGVLKLKNYDGSEKDIQISEIGKIYIENRSTKLYFFYSINILLIVLSLFYPDYFEILIATSIILLVTFFIINRYVKFKSKFLIIKFKKNKLVYSCKFNSINKEMVLRTIREVKSIKNSGKII
jgi:hypothetical protein